jgi:hypothetical protein
LNKRLFALFACLIPLALVAAGCGSSSDTTESTASISKAEFVKQADSICATTEKQNEKEFNEFFEEEGVSKNKPPSKEMQEQAIQAVAIPSLSSQLEEIRALGFPDQESESILESAEEDLAEVEEKPSALFSQNTFKETNKKARAYGLVVCGSEEGEEPEEG